MLPSTQLLAVLHGLDDALERFWGMEDRRRFYHVLENCRFTGVTGPTFSVNGESKSHPASHNVLMMLRHNRVLQELGKTALTAVPNVYWRTAADRMRWVEWLDENREVRVLSRDFACTPGGKPFERQFSDLLEILRGADRPLHVIFQGIGKMKAARVVRNLASLGCTATIATGQPILSAINHGHRWEFRGEKSPNVTGGRPVPNSTLAVENARIFERHLMAVTEELAIYDRDCAKNGQLGPAEPVDSAP